MNTKKSFLAQMRDMKVGETLTVDTNVKPLTSVRAAKTTLEGDNWGKWSVKKAENGFAVVSRIW